MVGRRSSEQRLVWTPGLTLAVRFGLTDKFVGFETGYPRVFLPRSKT